MENYESFQRIYRIKSAEIAPSKEVDIAGGISDSEKSSVYSFEIIQQEQLEKIQQTKNLLLNSSCFTPMKAEIDVILAHAAFAEFLFGEGDLQKYYIDYVDNRDKDGLEEGLVIAPERGLILMLSKFQQNEALKKQLAESRFYSLPDKCFSFGFVAGILQDRAFVGSEIAEHFRKNVTVFSNLGTIVQDISRQACVVQHNSSTPAFNIVRSRIITDGASSSTTMARTSQEIPPLVSDLPTRRHNCCILL